MPDLLTDEEVGLTEELTDAEVGLGPIDVKPTPYQAADIASMSAGLGKAPTGMEAGTELLTAIAEDPERFLQTPLVPIPRIKPQSTLGKIVAAPVNLAGGLIQGAETPLGALTLPLGGPVVKGVFAGLAAKAAGEQLGEASVTKDPGQITEGILGAGLAPAIGLHRTLPRAPEWQGPLATGELLRMAEGARVRRERMQREPIIVPETAPEPQRGMTVLQEIRTRDARTKEQIRALFPQLSREEAATLRDQAWGEEAVAEQARVAVAEQLPKGEKLKGQPTIKLSPEAEAAVSDIIGKAEQDLPKAAEAAKAQGVEPEPAPTNVYGAKPIWINDLPKSAKPLSEGAESGDALIRQLWDSYQQGNLFARDLLGPDDRSLYLRLDDIREAIKDYPSKVKKAIQQARQGVEPSAEPAKPVFRFLPKVGGKGLGDLWSAEGEKLNTKPITAEQAAKLAADKGGELIHGAILGGAEEAGKISKETGIPLAPPEPAAEPKPEPAPSAKRKEPWQMTKAEYRKFRVEAGAYPSGLFEYPDAVDKYFSDTHRGIIQMALKRGRPVPPEVLADYPDLKPPEPAPSAKGETAQPWYASLGEETKQNIFAVMRKIQEHVDAGAERERALRPRQGEIAAGAAGFDEFVRSEAQAQVLRAVRKGMTPEQAGDEAKTWAREAVATHNKKRPKDYNWARDEGTADTTIERAVEELNEVAKPTPTPSPPAASAKMEGAKTKRPKVGEVFAKIGDYEFALIKGDLPERPDMYAVGMRRVGSSMPFESGGYGHKVKPEQVINDWAEKEIGRNEGVQPEFSHPLAETTWKAEVARQAELSAKREAEATVKRQAEEKVSAAKDEYEKAVKETVLPKGKLGSITVQTEGGNELHLTGTAYGEFFVSKTDSKVNPRYKVTHIKSGLGVSGPGFTTKAQALDYVRALIHAKVRTDFPRQMALTKEQKAHFMDVGRYWIGEGKGDVPKYFKPEPPTPSPAEPGMAGPGTGIGPGSAHQTDRPAAPRQARAAGAAVEQAPPEARPLGAVSTVSVGLNNVRQAIKNIGTTLKGIAGHTMPKTTASNRLVGEAGARYLSSRIAARPLAATFSARVLENTSVDPIKLGAALTEDNLRSIRESMRAQVTELMSEGKHEEAADMARQADNVATIIGSKNSPFPTEDAYFDFLADPSTKKAIAQHLQLWQEIIDPQYRDAQSIDPDVELPSRGQQTGARINLKAVLPDQPATKPVLGSSASLTATFKKKSPFGVKARGTGQSYDVDYHSIIRNTFERQLEIANKNAFDKMLVQNGLAAIDKPGRNVQVGGKTTVAFPLQRRIIVSGKKGEKSTFSQAQNIYVRSDLADEYRSAANVDRKFRWPVITPVMDLLNRAALAGLTDGTVHISNQMTALFNRPVSGKFWTDTLLSATGRADVPVTLARAVIKSFKDNAAQVSELSEIGAMRPQGDIHYGVFGRVLQRTDRITRLLLDDTFKELVRQGLVPNTETARREYVNQIGQYNRRAQGLFTRFARDVGFGPFVTAGKTFNSLGVKMATLSPGAPAANTYAAAALRANVLSKWVGGAVLVGTMNYLITGKMLGRAGTKIGDIDTGKNDKSGKQLSLPFLSLLGLGRGLRVTGLSGAINAKRMGLSDSDAIDAATRDIINSWTAPYAGPPVKFGAIAATGYQPAVNVGRASRIVPPGESQFNQNVGDAIRQSSPVIQTYIKAREGKSVPEILATQIPRFTMQPGKTESMVENYPRIVSMAQGAAFINDMIHEARRMDPDKRIEFVVEQVKRLPIEQQAHALREAHRRKVYQ